MIGTSYRALVSSVAMLAGLSGVSQAAAGPSTCDPGWSGTGVGAAASGAGHLVAVRGMDGHHRINQFLNSAQKWSGWITLNSDGGATGRPWVQAPSVTPGAPIAQNVFALGGETIYQWIVQEGSGSVDDVLKTPFPLKNTTGASIVGGGFASAQLTRNTSDAQQLLMATFSDGHVRYRLWHYSAELASLVEQGLLPRGSITYVWDDAWLDLGPVAITNAASIPYAVQIADNIVNVYVRTTTGATMQNYWNGSSWSGWVTVTGSNTVSEPLSVYNGGHTLFSLNSSGGTTLQKYISISTPVGTRWQWTGWQSLALGSTTPGAQLGSTTALAVAPLPGADNWVMYGLDASGSVWQATNTTLAKTMPNCKTMVNK